MKPLLIILLLAGIAAGAKAQTTFATADTMSVGVLKTGSLTSSAPQHYYKTVLPANAILRIITSTTNAGSAFGGVRYTVYWKSQSAITNSTFFRNPSAGGTDTFIVGGIAADTLFLLAENVNSGQSFNYTIRYDMPGMTPNNETGPNETIATAEPLAINTQKDGHISFSTQGSADVDDYYKLVFPKNGTMRIFARTTILYTAYAVPSPTLYVLDRNGNAVSLFRATGSGGGSQTIAGLYGNALLSGYDTMSVFGRAQDTMYIRVNNYHYGLGAAWAASYSLQWTLADTAANNEPEPNSTTAQAPVIAEGATINGDISYVNAAGADLDDYYRIVLTKDATITLYASAQNTWNRQANPAPIVYVLDKNGNGLLVQNNAGAQSGSLNIANKGALPFLSSVTDTMNVFGRAKDTFFVRINNYHYGLGSPYASHYTLSYRLTDTSRYNEQGQNETKATAQAITQADTVSAHVSYVAGNGSTDLDDYYRIVKPAGGAIVLYITARNTWGYLNSLAGAPFVQAIDKFNNQLAIKSGTGAAGGSLRVRNNNQLAYGQSVTDTMVISCITSDTVYLNISNYHYGLSIGVASQYQFRYELIPGPKSDFVYSRVGSEFGFVNNSKFADSYLWIMGNGSTYTSYAPPVTNYTIPNAYTVKLVTVQGACAYRDTAFAAFTITGIEHYAPRSAGRGGDIAFQIFGGGLDSTTGVVLKQGSTMLTPTKKYTNSKKNFLTAVMDLHNVPAGLYDVVITVPGLAPITYTNGFRVDSFLYPYAWSQVSGPPRWLANRPTRFNLVVGNNGNVMASGVVVAMLWPKSAQLKWLKEDYKPSFAGTDTFVAPATGKMYTVLRSAYQFIYDSVDMFSPIDSFEGKPYDGYIKFFQIPFIPANSTVTIPFNVTASAPALQRFITYTHRPNIFGSCPNGNQEDFMNDMSGELIDAVDGFADKTKVPLFQAFTKTAKVGQFHMRSAATYVGDEFWAWYDGYETDHNANEAAWIGRTEEANQKAEQVFAQEAGDALLSHAVGRAKIHNDQVNYYNKLLANNPRLSPKSFDKAIDILNKNGKALGGINYDRLKLLKDLYDKTKDMGSQSEKIAKLLELINNCPELKDQQKEILDMLGGELDHNGGSETNTNTVNSFDPNDIYGPPGVGTPRYTSSLQRQPFLVTFENVDTASADAQTVVVLDTIDKTKFDIGSLSLGDAVVGGQTFRVSQGRNAFMVQNGMDSISGIKLRIVATTDTVRGIIRWQFTALDSVTNNRPLLKGFLPPNKNGVQGAGSVNYTIKPSQTATDGDALNSHATIVFDSNAAIATNVWTNTIDLLPPTSQVVSATHVHDSTIMLRFSGSDATSGVQKYKVYYATNGGLWKQLGDAADDSMLITGQPDSSYSFYCVAIDKVENRELKAPVAEASVKVPPLGISNTIGAGEAFSLFPNPANSRAYIRLLLKSNEDIDICLQTMTGAEVAKFWSGKPGANRTLPIDLSNIPAGVYLVVLKMGSGARMTAKMVVLH